MRRIKKVKLTIYLLVMLFSCGLYAVPHNTREGDTVFAFNIHNLGRVFERVIQLPEDRGGPYGLTGRRFQEHHQRAL